MKILLVALLLSLSLTACGSKFEGTYSNGNGAFYFTFTSNGKVTSNIFASNDGKEREGSYVRDGNQIKIHVPGEKEFVWTLNEGGSISAGGMIGLLTKK